MASLDEACRYAAKLDGAGFLGWLLGPDAGLVFVRWLDTRTVALPRSGDRTSDLIAELIEGGVGPFWALPVEFQAQPDADMLARLLELLGRLWSELRTAGPARDRYQLGAGVINLTGRGQATCDMAVGGRLRLCLQVAERNVQEEDAAATVERIAQGEVTRNVLAWIPLMKGGGEAGIIERWKAVAGAEPDRKRRTDYGELARTLSEAAGQMDSWKQGLEGWDLMESTYLREFELKERAATIMDVLRARFGPDIPPDVKTAVESSRDRPRLSHWTTLAATTSSLEDFRRAAGI
jgi:hypothetical protein